MNVVICKGSLAYVKNSIEDSVIPLSSNNIICVLSFIASTIRFPCFSLTSFLESLPAFLILGIINSENYQMVISDTPGILKPAHKLHESMMDFVNMTFEDADILLYMVEYKDYKLKDSKLYNKIKSTKTPLFLLINKIDDRE
mgnify:CR=1 FL=1